jgi:hypothetical protein
MLESAQKYILHLTLPRGAATSKIKASMCEHRHRHRQLLLLAIGIARIVHQTSPTVNDIINQGQTSCAHDTRTDNILLLHTLFQPFENSSGLAFGFGKQSWQRWRPPQSSIRGI